MEYSTMTNPNNNAGIDEGLKEIISLQERLLSSSTPEELKEDTSQSIERLKRMIKLGGYSSEFENVNKYIDWITKVPWGITSKDNLDIRNAKALLDSSHHGMESVKNLILDYLAAMQLSIDNSRKLEERNVGSIPTQIASFSQSPSPRIHQKVSEESSLSSPVFLFLGLQGVGKTSIAKSIADAMDRKFARISLGAIGDVRTLRGTPRYSPDGEPGQIVKALIRCGSMNPVILLDEIEKASGSAGLLSDVMATLLEILDPEQNSTFMDHYIDYPIDLSKVMFICTANNLGGLSAALIDRVEVIRFTSYSDDEKGVIAKKYILPKILEDLHITPEQLEIEEDVWLSVIRPVGFDAGIRQLERNISAMIRSAARKIVDGAPLPVVIRKDNLREFLDLDQGPLS